MNNKNAHKDTDPRFVKPVKLDPVRTEPKIGRNKECPCGSKKKYKNCCGK